MGEVPVSDHCAKMPTATTMQRVNRAEGAEGRQDDAGGAVVRLVAAAPGSSEDDLRAIRTRVLNVVGHELRTPVTTLRGLADALSTVDAQTAQDHVIPAIQRSAERLERLVDDLLIANGISTALPVGRPEPVAVAPLVHATWTGLGGSEGLAVEGEETAHAQAAALGGALERVLENAKQLGDEPPTVRLSRDADGLVTIEVDAPGPPVDEEEVRLATELLFRGHAAVMRYPGLGLGLPVARALVEHAGGALTVAGRPAGGLITVLTVPGAPA